MKIQLVLSLFGVLAAQASATWSILIVDTRTGEIAVASATCVERINLQRDTPVLISGVGAVTAQSALDASGLNRLTIRDRLLEGIALSDILDELSIIDSGHDNRQYGMIDITGDTLTYSGIQNADWAGGQTGRIEMGAPGPADDLVYAVQGNILSGPNVVQAAVDAIIETDGDLADRLMAAMLAARFDGGDGRCSCNITNPTACGSPPPAPFKSAHVGYMLIARLDDMDAARARYNIDGRATGFAFPDLDSDGINDIACSWTIGTQIKLFENPTAPGLPLTYARQIEGIEVGAQDQLGIVQCDLNNDALLDLAIIADDPQSVVAVLNNGAGGYSAPISIALDNTPTGFAAADLDGSGRAQLVVAVGASNEVHTIALNEAKNTLEIMHTSPVSGSPRGLTLAHLNGDSTLDLAVTQRTDNTVWIGVGSNNGFTHTTTLQTANQPVAIQSADLNNDARDDLVVVTRTGQLIESFLHEADHSFADPITASLPDNATNLRIGDLTGNAVPDLAVMVDSIFQLRIYTGDGAGAFTFHTRQTVGADANAIALADLNTNGTLDVYTGARNSGSLSILDNLSDGTFPPNQGFAMGNYYLTFNIANRRLVHPDPVDDMALLFNDWQSSKHGVVDAVQSAVSAPSRVQRQSDFSIVVNLHDRSASPINADKVDLEVLSQAGLVAVGSIIQTANNQLTISLTAGEPAGLDSIVIRATQGENKIRLMPDVQIRVLETIADFDANGSLNIFDLLAFLDAFNAQDPAADLDRSNAFDANDIFLFVKAFLGN